MMMKRQHDDVQASLEVHTAAFAGSLALCRKVGLEDALPSALMHNMQRALREGYGAQEISALFEVMLTKGDKAADSPS
jgi:hypothetical protein